MTPKWTSRISFAGSEFLWHFHYLKCQQRLESNYFCVLQVLQENYMRFKKKKAVCICDSHAAALHDGKRRAVKIYSSKSLFNVHHNENLWFFAVNIIIVKWYNAEDPPPSQKKGSKENCTYVNASTFAPFPKNSTFFRERFSTFSDSLKFFLFFFLFRLWF